MRNVVFGSMINGVFVLYRGHLEIISAGMAALREHHRFATLEAVLAIPLSQVGAYLKSRRTSGPRVSPDKAGHCLARA
ncbi:MAG: hypothetical protein RJQ08_13535 [Salinisphaeraceae bacterium]